MLKHSKLTKRAAKETETSIRAFATKHPDWKTFEKMMITLAKNMPARSDESDAHWLERLYRKAKKC